jgi:FO synthase subunit 1
VEEGDVLLDTGSVADLLRRGAESGCSEALFTFGEQPWKVEGFSKRLEAIGFSSFMDYLLECLHLAISMGLLPHTNAGVLSEGDLRRLKPFNASMGLMLESTADLEAHRNSPGKRPLERLRFIELAGRLQIPFTTGILVGIGESEEDRRESLEAIARIHERYGHIQEVIVQNFSPKPHTKMKGVEPPAVEVMVKTVSLARQILPDDVAVQVAPNLTHPRILVEHGAGDLGGISPVTMDYINPEAAWPRVEELEKRIGLPLRERLPIYPKYVRAGWYSEELKPLIERLADSRGFRKV